MLASSAGQVEPGLPLTVKEAGVGFLSALSAEGRSRDGGYSPGLALTQPAVRILAAEVRSHIPETSTAQGRAGA